MGRKRTFKRCALALLGLSLLSAPLAEGAESHATGTNADNLRPTFQTNLVRIGIAPGTWGGVNRNDASAAIAAWAKIILRQQGKSVDAQTTLFESDAEMGRELRDGRVEAVSMLTHQFLALEPRLQPDAVFLATRNHLFTERYILLVHRGSGIDNLSGLRGCRILLQNNSRTSLAPQWLDTILARRSLGPAVAFFETVTRIENPSKVVLPVFFRQAQACLVTSNVFALAGELNPQVHRDLRVLATSPEVIPSLFYFRPGPASTTQEQLEPAILALHETPAGQQVLTVFQGDGMVKRPLSCLEESRRLLAEYQRLCAHVEKPRSALPPTERVGRETPSATEGRRDNESHSQMEIRP